MNRTSLKRTAVVGSLAALALAAAGFTISNAQVGDVAGASHRPVVVRSASPSDDASPTADDGSGHSGSDDHGGARGARGGSDDGPGHDVGDDHGHGRHSGSGHSGSDDSGSDDNGGHGGRHH